MHTGNRWEVSTSSRADAKTLEDAARREGLSVSLFLRRAGLIMAHTGAGFAAWAFGWISDEELAAEMKRREEVSR